MIERRTIPRRKTFLGARLIFNHRQFTMDCVVKNMGKGGAKAVFSHTTAVPDDVEIKIIRMDTVLSARIAWRREDEVGLVFVEAAERNVIPLDLAVRIRKLEADKVLLQRRVEALTSGA